MRCVLGAETMLILLQEKVAIHLHASVQPEIGCKTLQDLRGTGAGLMCAQQQVAWLFYSFNHNLLLI